MRAIFAGGGTAGHVNPALAVANYLKKMEPESEIWFFGGTGNIEETLVQKAGYPIYTFPLKGLSRSKSLKGMAQNVKALADTWKAIQGCKKIVRELKPDIVMGTGGYASFAMVYAAAQCGVKTAVLEVNAVPGITVKQLSGKVDCVMLNFAETAKYVKNAKRTEVTGSPIREEIVNCMQRDDKPLFENNMPLVVSFWGSVGALYMNKKMEDFILCNAQTPRFNHIHAAGSSQYPWMVKEVVEKGVDLDACDHIDLWEYIYDMDKVLAQADLVICRGGGTLAELCAAGKPSIVVPSPYAAENHQEKNARILEAAGAAVVVTEAEATGALLYEKACALLAQPEYLAQMGENARKKGHPEAIDHIYRTLKSL